MNADPTASTAARPKTGRWMMWAGVVLAILAIALVVVQYSIGWLIVPWYAPLLTTAGAAALAWSLRKRRSVVRVLAFGLVALLAGLQWHFLLSASKLPSYDGPVKMGQQIPAFHTRLANGQTFTEQDFDGGLRSALVFFRGRW
jgi:hypothetical protein